MDTAQLRRQDFDENGYIVIKNAFTEEEIDKIRSATLESLASRRAQGKGFTSDKNAYCGSGMSNTTKSFLWC